MSVSLKEMLVFINVSVEFFSSSFLLVDTADLPEVN